MSCYLDSSAISFEELDRLCTHDRRPFFDIAIKECGEGSTVLDIGAGEGDFASLCKPDVYLVDANPESVASLRRKYANVYEHRVPDPLPFQDAFFDVIHCSHLVEHLQPEELYLLLGEVHRVLKPAGCFVVSTPLLWSGFYDDLSHVRPYPPAVFGKYMCQPGGNATRSSIASGYEVEQIVYRYSQRVTPYYSVSNNRIWAKKLLHRFIGRLRRHRLVQYEVSGYTMVLRKPSLLS